MLKSHFIYKFFLLLLVVLLPFQNFFLNQTALGVFGSNLSLVPINFLFLIILLKGFSFLRSYIGFIFLFFLSIIFTFVSLLFFTKIINKKIKV